MKNLKITILMASALVGAFGLLSFRPAADTTNDWSKTYCDSTDKELISFVVDSTDTDTVELAGMFQNDTTDTDTIALALIFQNDTTDGDTLEFTNALFLALNDSTEVDSLFSASLQAFAGDDTTKDDDCGTDKDKGSLYSLYMRKAIESDSTDTDSLTAV
jgi:hypothetical protein